MEATTPAVVLGVGVAYLSSPPSSTRVSSLQADSDPGMESQSFLTLTSALTYIIIITWF